MSEYDNDNDVIREGIKNEYHVSYIKHQQQLTPYLISGGNLTFGSFVAKPTDLRGVQLVEWLREIIADHDEVSKDDIVIISISEVGSYVYQID